MPTKIQKTKNRSISWVVNKQLTKNFYHLPNFVMQQHDFSAPPAQANQQSHQQHQQVVISRCDRWQVHQRLTELDIASTCHPDGTFEVEIYSPITVVQLYSVLAQFTGSRQRLVDWLEQCWQNSR
jgi:hypothetical protein